nr:hypothetical protein [Tanacetum cinerariifolium]
MVNLPPPNNDPNVPEGDQALAIPNGFAPQWIGEHDSNNNNGWIEWDVPLGEKVDEPMVDPDDAPRATVTVSSTYEIGGPSTAAVEGPSAPLPAPGLPVADSIVIGEIHPRVATVEEQVQVMESQAVQVLRTRVVEMESHVGILMSYMLWIEEHLTVLEKRLPGPPPGPQ